MNNNNTKISNQVTQWKLNRRGKPIDNEIGDDTLRDTDQINRNVGKSNYDEMQAPQLRNS